MQRMTIVSIHLLFFKAQVIIVSGAPLCSNSRTGLLLANGECQIMVMKALVGVLVWGDNIIWNRMSQASAGPWIKRKLSPEDVETKLITCTCMFESMTSLSFVTCIG